MGGYLGVDGTPTVHLRHLAGRDQAVRTRKAHSYAERQKIVGCVENHVHTQRKWQLLWKVKPRVEHGNFILQMSQNNIWIRKIKKAGQLALSLSLTLSLSLSVYLPPLSLPLPPPPLSTEWQRWHSIVQKAGDGLWCSSCLRELLPSDLLGPLEAVGAHGDRIGLHRTVRRFFLTRLEIISAANAYPHPCDPLLLPVSVNRSPRHCKREIERICRHPVRSVKRQNYLGEITKAAVLSCRGNRRDICTVRSRSCARRAATDSADALKGQEG